MWPIVDCSSEIAVAEIEVLDDGQSWSASFQ